MKELSQVPISRVCLFGLIIAFLALSPAFLPYGGAYVTRGDYIEQQLPFLAETQRILRNGLNTYSFSTLLGAPAIGSYAFYTLGSPFVWPLALLPKAALPFGITLMALLKHTICMLTSFLYFRKMLSDDARALLGAVMYTFSSFTVVNTQFYHFTEVIAFFPLILLGIENVMTGRTHAGHLALACGLNTLVNYYFMFGSALLVFFYVLFRFFSPAWKSTHRFLRLLLVLFECAIGCALAGVILCPALLYMLQITRTGSGADLLHPYPVPDILERIRVFLMPIESGVVHAFYGQAASWTSTAAWLPLFGAAGTFVFLVKCPETQRWLRRLIILLIILSFIPVLCGLFVLESNQTYTRWWYGLVLMMTLATLKALDSDRPFSDLNIKAWRHGFLFCTLAVLLLTVPFLLPESVLRFMEERAPSRLWRMILRQKEEAYAPLPFIWFSLGMTLVSFLCLALCLFRKDRISARSLTLLASIVAVLAYSGYIRTGDTYLLSGGTQPGSGIYRLDEIARPTLSSLRLAEPSGYKRIDYGTRIRNYGLLRGTSSLTVFHSLRQSLTGRFLSMAGLGYDESTTIHTSGTDGALRTFLSTSEYHLTSPDDSVPEGFVYSHDENGFPVYTNEHSVPMGFLQTVCTGTHDQPMTPDTLGSTLLAAVALDEPWLSQAKERLDTLDVHHIPDWTESARNLSRQACDRFETDASGFSAHIRSDRPGYLVFTIPYDKGFTAAVDGNTVPIIPCDVCFMAVFIEAGEHTIRFTFHNRFYHLGIAVSAVSLVILLLYDCLAKKVVFPFLYTDKSPARPVSFGGAAHKSR